MLMAGGTTFNMTNKVIFLSGFNLQDTANISYVTPFIGNMFTLFGLDFSGGEKQILITSDYIKSKVQSVNVNLQSAEDTRATLTNLITILKNL